MPELGIKKYTPIDFASTDRPVSAEIVTMNTTIYVSEGVLDFISTHYSRVSGILGLGNFPELYEVQIDYLGDKARGELVQPKKNGDTGIIRLDATMVMNADYDLDPDKRVADTKSPREDLAYLTYVIAHELFHKMHATQYPTSYKLRKEHYVQSSEDFARYRKQQMEVWARLFAKKYLEVLLFETEHKQSPFALGLEKIISQIELTLV